MGYMKEIDIRSQNILESVIDVLLETIEFNIERQIQISMLISAIDEAVLIETVQRLYDTYTLLQLQLW